MLVAQADGGVRVEARRDLPSGDFRCPACAAAVILKRCRIKVAHFAHRPGAECENVGEGADHLHAKRTLADRFRALGYAVELEEAHPAEGRRIDLAVTVPTPRASCRVAVEVQDSPISVGEMKRRMAADRRLGFLGTAWLFIGRRARVLLATDHPERRVPNEILWLDRRYCCGVDAFDGSDVYHVEFDTVVREGGSSEWYEAGGVLCGEDYPDRTLLCTKTLSVTPAGFRLTCSRGRYHLRGRPDWHLGFAH